MGAQNRPQEVPRGNKNDIEKQIKKRDGHKSLNNEKKELLSSPGALPDIDPFAIGLRLLFGASNICRRPGPLKLMSKLIS